MTFDEWMLTVAPKHKPTDDGVTLRILCACWEAAAAAERERWREIAHRVAADANRYGREGLRLRCTISKGGGLVSWEADRA